MEAKKQAEIQRREEELRQAAHGAKQNYAQAKFSKLSNAYDSMTSNNRIITDASQLPNQENFFVPAQGSNKYQGTGNPQTLADMYQ